MANLFGNNNIRIMYLLYSVEDYIYFIKEYRQFEKLPVKYCAFKIQMIFNDDDDLAERLVEKWKEIDNNFPRFFLNLNTVNQKKMLDYLQIPITVKKSFNENENTNSPHYADCTLVPDSLGEINHLLFYFNNRNINEPISDLKLPHCPEEISKSLANGSNWADYIISLTYEEQVFVLLKILQN